MSLWCEPAECSGAAQSCYDKCVAFCGTAGAVSLFECKSPLAVCDCLPRADGESSEGGGVDHGALWGSVAGVVIMICCVVTFYKYWCSGRRSSERIVIIQQ